MTLRFTAAQDAVAVEGPSGPEDRGWAVESVAWHSQVACRGKGPRRWQPPGGTWAPARWPERGGLQVAKRHG